MFLSNFDSNICLSCGRQQNDKECLLNSSEGSLIHLPHFKHEGALLLKKKGKKIK